MLMFEQVLHFKVNAVLLQLFVILSLAHMHALDDRELSYFKDLGESYYVILLLYFILYYKFYIIVGNTQQQQVYTGHYVRYYSVRMCGGN